MEKSLMVCMLMLIMYSASGQVDSSFILKLKAVEQYNNLKVDTAEPPDDGLTQKIMILRQEKGGVSIETIIQIKMAENVKDTSKPAAFYRDLKAEVTTGR